LNDSEGSYSQIVVDDRYVFLSGLVAADFPEGQKVLGDVKKETRAILTAIRSMLAEMGLDINRIVLTDVHLANLDGFEQMDDGTGPDAIRKQIEKADFVLQKQRSCQDESVLAAPEKYWAKPINCS